MPSSSFSYDSQRPLLGFLLACCGVKVDVVTAFPRSVNMKGPGARACGIQATGGA